MEHIMFKWGQILPCNLIDAHILFTNCADIIGYTSGQRWGFKEDMAKVGDEILTQQGVAHA